MKMYVCEIKPLQIKKSKKAGQARNRLFGTQSKSLCPALSDRLAMLGFYVNFLEFQTNGQIKRE